MIATRKSLIMTEINHDLFSAFREDHAVLGRGLHELRTLVLANEIGSLKAAAKKLDRNAGAHIAFEEENFYPALKAFLSSQEVDNMYDEHAHGAATLEKIDALAETGKLEPEQIDRFIERIDEMENHVSECGELFGAMGGLDRGQKEALLTDLLRWRRSAPSWTEYAHRRQKL